jgi:hypothetical protein
MHDSVGKLLYNAGAAVIQYLPSLLGGLLLLVVGILLGWVAKRVVAQICLILRVDRALRGFRWARSLDKADARHAFYDMIGAWAFFIVFLTVFHAALSTMRLTILSDLLQRGVLFLPRFLIALIIAGFGMVIAGRTAASILRALASEDVPKARLIARLSKGVLILFFSAMALTELDIARNVVLIGFTTIMATVCVMIILVLGPGGRRWLARILEKSEDPEDPPR